MLIALLLLPSQQQIQTWAMSGFLSLKVRHIICFQDLSSEAGLFWPRSLVGFYVVHFISDSYRKSRERFQIGNKLNLRTNCFIFFKKQNLVVVFFLREILNLNIPPQIKKGWLFYKVRQGMKFCLFHMCKSADVYFCPSHHLKSVSICRSHL